MKMKTETMLLLGLGGYLAYRAYQSKQVAASATAAAAQNSTVTAATDSPSTDAVVTPASAPTPLVATTSTTETTTDAAMSTASPGNGGYVKDQGNRMDSGWNFGGASLMGRRGR